MKNANQCDMCNKAFGTSQALKAHKLHKISKCEICGQTLCTTFWLELHMSASHESLRKTNFIIKQDRRYSDPKARNG